MLINYLPEFLRNIDDFKELFKSLDIEIKYLNEGIEYIINQSNILKANEKRIQEWEEFLKIDSQGDLLQRKKFIIATLTTVGKLNKSKIEEIVNIYTNGGGAEVEFSNSTIIVKVKPPKGNEDFLFPDIERTLEKMKPAHLGLIVIRDYVFWNDIYLDFDSWDSVFNNFETWKDVKNYIIGKRKKYFWKNIKKELKYWDNVKNNFSHWKDVKINKIKE